MELHVNEIEIQELLMKNITEAVCILDFPDGSHTINMQLKKRFSPDRESNAQLMHQSIPAVPIPPPGNRGAFA